MSDSNEWTEVEHHGHRWAWRVHDGTTRFMDEDGYEVLTVWCEVNKQAARCIMQAYYAGRKDGGREGRARLQGELRALLGTKG